jgi:hypothetical protein
MGLCVCVCVCVCIAITMRTWYLRMVMGSSGTLKSDVAASRMLNLRSLGGMDSSVRCHQFRRSICVWGCEGCVLAC